MENEAEADFFLVYIFIFCSDNGGGKSYYSWEERVALR